MNLIVAVTEDYAIGKNNDLLFHLPKDLEFFKQTTLNKIVIMGERTYYSLPRRPLPKRINIVLSDNPNFNEEGIIIVRSLKDLLEEIKKYPQENVFVCGGASVYNLLMDYCKTAYITKVRTRVPADTFINNIEKKENWERVYESEIIEDNGLTFTFQTYKNNKVKE